MSTSIRQNSTTSTVILAAESQSMTKNGPALDSEKASSETASADSYLWGWRLHATIAGTMASTFLAVMEMTIVSTALVDITNSLDVFQISTWIINAYLVAFTAFLLIWAQFSFVVGRRVSVLVAYILFVGFSTGCAVSQTPLQLATILMLLYRIILRALQGVGGAGIFNISAAVIVEAVEPQRLPQYIALMSIIITLAYALGPLIGGIISSRVTWRWIFWINVIAAPVPYVFILIGLPPNFPHQNELNFKSDTRITLKRMDLLGGFFFLAAAVLFVTALEGADISFQWSSVTVRCLLTFAAFSFVAFIFWERHITLTVSPRVPILTWKFCARKPFSLLTIFFLVSTPFMSSVVTLPERFQVVNGLTPFEAGLHLLPFIVVVPLSSSASAIITVKLKIRHAHALVGGWLFQLVGVVCFIIALPVSTTATIPRRIYGFEAILAIGLGINNSVATMMIPYIVEKPLIAPATAAGMQFRYLGGAIGLGILTAVFNSRLRAGLPSLLSPSQLDSILKSSEAINDLPSEVQQKVIDVFNHGFEAQWKTLLGFVVAEIPFTLALL